MSGWVVMTATWVWLSASFALWGGISLGLVSAGMAVPVSPAGQEKDVKAAKGRRPRFPFFDGVASGREHLCSYGVRAGQEVLGRDGVEVLEVAFHGSHQQAGGFVDVRGVGPCHAHSVVAP